MFSGIRLSIISFLLIILVINACIPPVNKKPNDPRTFASSQENIYQVGSSLPYFIDYTRAMDRLKLDYLMKAEGPYTFYIPNPDGFSLFFEERNLSSLDQISNEELSEILLYHIIRNRWFINSTPTGYYPTLAKETVTGNALDLYISNKSVFSLNGKVCLGTRDIDCSNGIIQNITRIILPPTISDQLSFNEDFSMFNQILSTGNLDKDYINLLSEKGSYTLLAPTNEAIQTYLDEHDNWKTLNDIPPDTLQNIINSHLINADNFLLKNLEGKVTLNTLSGTNIMFELTINSKSGQVFRNYTVKFNDKTTRVQIPDIQSTNGVIQQIDRVLVP